MLSTLRLAYAKLGVNYRLDLIRYRLGQTHNIPHILKQRAIVEYSIRYALSSFVETGTYLGDMIAAVKPYFRELHTVELSEQLYLKARRRFASDSIVNVHFGDSAKVLPGILERCKSACLFWLDAHYSSGITARGAVDSPVTEELKLILSRGRHGDVILIDDASYFQGVDGYPTLKEVEQMVATHKPGYEYSVELDIIRIVPRIAASENAVRPRILTK